MFKYRLTRLPFAILSFGHSWWEFYQLKQNQEIGLLLVLASLPFLLVFVVWPRLRDCDWPLWIGFLLLVPYLGSLIGLSLLFAPSKVFNRRDQAAANAAAEAADKEEAARQIAGSSCAQCGTKIIMATEGVIRDKEILCKDCDAKRQGAEPAG